MSTARENLLCADYTDWIIQGFVKSTTDLEIFLSPSNRIQQNSSYFTLTGKSVRLFDVQKMEIWDFGMMQYDLLSYFIAVPFNGKILLIFASTAGCHSQIFCSKIEESMFENSGRWITKYITENTSSDLMVMDKHNDINKNWHDYQIDGFLRFGDKVEMLLSYPQLEISEERNFTLAGKLTFEGLQKQNISNFKAQNILSFINVGNNHSQLFVDFDCSIGCNGYITCRMVNENTSNVKGKWKILYNQD